MFFRSAAILTTLACAAGSFAAPLLGGLLGGAELPTNGLAARQLDFGSLLAGLPGAPKVAQREENAAEGLIGGGLLAGILGRDEAHATLPDVFAHACAEITPIAEELRAAVGVAVGVDIDVNVVVGLLGKIVVILKGVLVDVQFILSNPAGFVLSLKGTILSIKEVGLVVSTLLYVVVTVVAIVLRAVNVSVHAVVLPLVAQIGVLLAQIIVVVLRIVPGLLAHIVVIIHPIVADIYFLRYTDLIACLHLVASAN
ncbi:hypothetical protein D9613_010499 [Agrocybe pediades]|uniref:Uncharacterized protein n=1 Tax=Agrocybe pediades TaxID=84607 RepID=A0A8H4QG46_9AGAR|nr:hypothetical protein D9613_010499 [Agrocybe pediades]